MRSSRLSRETAALRGHAPAAPLPARRVTRSALARFAYGSDSAAPPVPDIEDIAGPAPRKRRRVVKDEATDSDTSSVSAVKTERPTVKLEREAIKPERFRSPTMPPTRRAGPSSLKAELPSVKSEPDTIKTEPPSIKAEPSANPRKRRLPARVIRGASPSVAPSVEPPTDWEEMYNLVRNMRLNGPARNAAVDTMGCDRLFRPEASPRDQRFHILIALMLSSQTKDTVNAVAMERLHTQLPPHKAGAPAGLNVENVLAVDPAKLNELIYQVGFHNNKTKYIKAAALILRDQHGSDIPDTIAGLTALPGVGPKMAHLCLSAAWGRTEGIGVDVHVHRLTNMWNWHKTATPEASRLALEAWLPRDKWREINTLLVGFGQTICPPQAGAKRCGECSLGSRGLCAGADRKKVAEARRAGAKVEADTETDGVKVEAEAEPAGAQAEAEAEADAAPSRAKAESTPLTKIKTEHSPRGVIAEAAPSRTRTNPTAPRRVKPEAAPNHVKRETSKADGGVEEERGNEDEAESSPRRIIEWVAGVKQAVKDEDEVDDKVKFEASRPSSRTTPIPAGAHTDTGPEKTEEDQEITIKKEEGPHA